MTRKVHDEAIIEPSTMDFGDTPDSVIDYIAQLNMKICKLETALVAALAQPEDKCPSCGEGNLEYRLSAGLNKLLCDKDTGHAHKCTRAQPEDGEVAEAIKYCREWADSAAVEYESVKMLRRLIRAATQNREDA